MRSDTLTEAERDFVKALGDDLPAYRDVVTAYALEQKSGKTVPAEGFTVTPAIRQQIYERLKQKGIDLTPEEFKDGARLVDQNLSYDVARYVFGRQAEFRRRARDDRQLQTALDLLHKAGTPKELLGLAVTGGVKGSSPN